MVPLLVQELVGHDPQSLLPRLPADVTWRDGPVQVHVLVASVPVQFHDRPSGGQPGIGGHTGMDTAAPEGSEAEATPGK